MQMPEDKKIAQYVILMRGGTYHFSPNIPLDCTNVAGVFDCMDSIYIRDRKPKLTVHSLTPHTLKAMHTAIDTTRVPNNLKDCGHDSIEMLIESSESFKGSPLRSLFSHWLSLNKGLNTNLSVFQSNEHEFSSVQTNKLADLANSLRSL